MESPHRDRFTQERADPSSPTRAEEPDNPHESCHWDDDRALGEPPSGPKDPSDPQENKDPPCQSIERDRRITQRDLCCRLAAGSVLNRFFVGPYVEDHIARCLRWLIRQVTSCLARRRCVCARRDWPAAVEIANQDRVRRLRWSPFERLLALLRLIDRRCGANGLSGPVTDSVGRFDAEGDRELRIISSTDPLACLSCLVEPARAGLNVETDVRARLFNRPTSEKELAEVVHDRCIDARAIHNILTRFTVTTGSDPVRFRSKLQAP